MAPPNKVSLSRTPNAKADTARTTESSATTIDVLLNDLGGDARSLYSLNQTDPATATSSGLSQLGAVITITGGKVGYDPTASARIQALGAGQTATDSFSYGMQVGAGTLSTATVLMTVTGVNDLAAITGNASGSVKEDGGLTTTGNLAVSDVDTGENTFGAIGNLTGQYGTFTFDKAKGDWGYTLGNDTAKVQTLAGGPTVYDTLKVSSKDGTATEEIKVAIGGANDVATFTGGSTGQVQEDGTLGVNGTIAVSDIDMGEGGFGTIGTLTGKYGTFSFDNGAWDYTLGNGLTTVQALKGTDTVYDTLLVGSKDGSASAEIKVTVKGAADLAQITGDLTGAVQEDGTLTIGGTLAVADLDAGENEFGATGTLAGKYGDFTFDKGAWAYTLNNKLSAVQALSSKDTVYDTLSVTSADGSASEQVKVTIAGRDEPLTTLSPTVLGNLHFHATSGSMLNGFANPYLFAPGGVNAGIEHRSVLEFYIPQDSISSAKLIIRDLYDYYAVTGTVKFYAYSADGLFTNSDYTTGPGHVLVGSAPIRDSDTLNNAYEVNLNEAVINDILAASSTNLVGLQLRIEDGYQGIAFSRADLVVG